MRRFEVYFLQKKIDGVWDTLERSQSVSLLVATLVREFDSHEDAEVRILAGAYDEGAQDWEFTQIFFVDRGAVELSLAERGDDGDGGSAGDGWTADRQTANRQTGDRQTGDSPTGDRWAAGDVAAGDAAAPRETVPGGRDFADAIRRASDEGEAVETDSWPSSGRRDEYDDLPDGEPPIGPPPRFDTPRRRGGHVFFIIGTILIALILTAAAVLALGIALDAPQVKPVMSVFRNLTASLGIEEPVIATGSNAVMPETTGQVITYQGVAPGLRGRWSPGHCDETYVEFDAEGLVVAAPGQPESLKVPVIETLEDDYTWFVRRSPDLVEHFQKLGKNDLQLIGDTTRIGFSSRTSDILTRCP